MRIEYLTDGVEVLRPLAEEWAVQGKSNGVGIDVHIQTIVDRAREWAQQENSEIIVAWESDEPVGLVCLLRGFSFLGRQTFAIEQHWYVKPGNNGVGPKLLEEAVMWADTHGCSHLIMGASRLGGMEFKVCQFYERHGFKPFSRSYIIEVA